MKGIHKVVVGTKYLKYEFELRRNLTIIRGDWERYFTALLTEKTAGTYLNDTKKTLNEAYLSDGVKNAILGQMQKVELN